MSRLENLKGLSDGAQDARRRLMAESMLGGSIGPVNHQTEMPGDAAGQPAEVEAEGGGMTPPAWEEADLTLPVAEDLDGLRSGSASLD